MAAVGNLPAQDAALLKTITTGDGAPPRIARVPLALADRVGPEQLITGLRDNYGEAPLDFLVLGRPISLAPRWRDNNFDHAAKLGRAWRVLSEAQQAGTTCALGIENAGPEILDLLRDGGSRSQPALNLIEFHPFLRADGLVARC